MHDELCPSRSGSVPSGPVPHICPPLANVGPSSLRSDQPSPTGLVLGSSYIPGTACRATFVRPCGAGVNTCSDRPLSASGRAGYPTSARVWQMWVRRRSDPISRPLRLRSGQALTGLALGSSYIPGTACRARFSRPCGGYKLRNDAKRLSQGRPQARRGRARRRAPAEPALSEVEGDD